MQKVFIIIFCLFCLQIEHEHQTQGLVALKSLDENFDKSLQALDVFPTRTYDSILVFFVRKGQYGAKDISCNEVRLLKDLRASFRLHSFAILLNRKYFNPISAK